MIPPALYLGTRRRQFAGHSPPLLKGGSGEQHQPGDIIGWLEKALTWKKEKLQFRHNIVAPVITNLRQKKPH
eukprot:1162046-Pelagomonas_calceolata.AAC.4